MCQFWLWKGTSHPPPPSSQTFKFVSPTTPQTREGDILNSPICLSIMFSFRTVTRKVHWCLPQLCRCMNHVTGVCCIVFYFSPCRRPGTGDIENTVRLSVCPSHLIFALTRKRIAVFSTRYVHHVMGVCCIVFDTCIDGMLFDFFYEILKNTMTSLTG